MDYGGREVEVWPKKEVEVEMFVFKPFVCCALLDCVAFMGNRNSAQTRNSFLQRSSELER